jgi:hypothetical protein
MNAVEQRTAYIVRLNPKIAQRKRKKKTLENAHFMRFLGPPMLTYS